MITLDFCDGGSVKYFPIYVACSSFQSVAGSEEPKGFVLLKLSSARALASSCTSDLQVSILSLPILTSYLDTVDHMLPGDIVTPPRLSNLRKKVTRTEYSFYNGDGEILVVWESVVLSLISKGLQFSLQLYGTFFCCKHHKIFDDR